MGRPLPPPSFGQCLKENVFFPLTPSLIPNILRFPNIILNISGGGIGKNVLWVMLMTVKKLEECHDVLQAGRAKRAEAGRAGLFTEQACSTLEGELENCVVCMYNIHTQCTVHIIYGTNNKWHLLT